MAPTQRSIRRNEALHRQVARTIRNDIEAGVLRDGEVLPATRELAARFGVSGYTINSAMTLLADEGLVLSKTRSRRIVTAPDQQLRPDRRATPLQVVLVGGYAGSGKSEFGRILAKKTTWPILDKDTLTRPLVETALDAAGLSPHDRESDYYVDAVRPREYDGLMGAVDENLQCGTSVIATAPFVLECTDEMWTERTRSRCAELGATLRMVWMECDIPTMHTYLRQRGAARDAAKLAHWDAYVATLDVDLRPAGSHFVVSNSSSSRPLQEQAYDLIDRIRKTDAT